MIEAKNLVKLYDNKHKAVDGISFTIEKGHVVGFLGPNGAGKSTTMNMITGYISATEGEISIAGHDIYDEPEEAKRHIGYLPENPPLYPGMKVQEYLNFVADLKRVPRRERKAHVDEIIQKTGLEEYRNRLIKQLSKGYKQRVGMAEALVGYPEVLIFDEPTVGLDPAQIIEIRSLIKELSKEHTIILSSHIMQEISAVCDIIMIIDKGHLLLNDKAENLTKYINRKAGLFLEVTGSKENVEAVLSGIEEIQNVVFRDDAESGNCRLVIYAKEDSDIRGKLFGLLAEKGCNIVTMKDEEVTLEDIFLEITGEAEAARNGATEKTTAPATEEAEAKENGEAEDDSNI